MFRESKSGKIYQGLEYYNHCDLESKWLTSIYGVEIKNTSFVAQCKAEDDYQKFLERRARNYAEPIITVLVKNSKKVVDK